MLVILCRKLMWQVVLQVVLIGGQRGGFVNTAVCGRSSGEPFPVSENQQGFEEV